MMSILLAISMAAASGTTPAVTAGDPIIRQVKTVRVNGQDEQWRLVWAAAPSPVCVPEDDNWYTCPCMGFAFGERGHLRLERLRNHTIVDTLDLDQFFTGFDGPAIVFEKRESILRRWDVLDGDDNLMNDGPGLRTQLDSRPPADVMEMVDFDHDGQASEFFLQVGELPCGKRMGVIVGVSKSRPHLHAFATAEHPARPLVLQEHVWIQVSRQAKGHAISWPCGDHGADQQSEITWHVNRTGIHAHVTTFACGDNGPRERLIEKTAL